MLSPKQARNIAAGLALEAGAAVDVEIGDGADHANLPQRIGGYSILRAIAAGGMGAVYEAQQEYPRRIVALKVLKRDLVSRTALRRFRYETEVLARLHHPGIAQIYDAGTHDDGFGGVPYFVMEYITDALPITRYADEHQLDVRARLELFAQICDAVNHGHQNRIIHRDLKPANILVDQHGAVKIIDFGIACATDADVTLTTLHTDSRAIIGTLQYMSPEQATGGGISPSLEEGGQRVGEALDPRNDHSPLPLGEGPPGTGVRARTATSSLDTPSPQPSPRGRGIETAALDTRTDIYSLGVILYELVCGQLPYDLSGSSITQATRIIEQADPPRPTAIWREKLPLPLGEGRGEGVSEAHLPSRSKTSAPRRHRALIHDIRSPRALEAIVLKAMSKDRRRRYQTAAALVDDVRRYQNGEPVEAKPPSKWMRATRWVGRHPVAATVLACIILGGVFTASITTFGVWWTNSQPSRFVISADNRVAHLVSRSGRHLSTLGGGSDSWIIAAMLADRVRGAETERVAVYCVQGQSGERLTGCQLTVASADNLDRVYWQTSGEPPYISIPPPFYFPHTVFNVTHARVADVFADAAHPGNEIIVVHSAATHPGSPSALRVYDFDCSVLFEMWHMGPIQHIAWLQKHGLLVCVADRHAINWDKANQWVRENQPELPIDLEQGHWPIVVFGLQPRLGARANWIEPQIPQARGESDIVRWYRCVLPLTYRVKPTGDRRGFIPYFWTSLHIAGTSTISLALQLPSGNLGSATLLIDSDGELITHDPSDAYIALERRGEAPLPAKSFRLGDLPEIGETIEETNARWAKGPAQNP